MNDLIEVRILKAVKKLLTEQGNGALHYFDFAIPPIEFGGYCGSSAVVPSLSISSCEMTEKERIVAVAAYSVTITFTVPETPDSEIICYGYAAAVQNAVWSWPTLGGVADYVRVTSKKYNGPKKSQCGQGWEVVITLRITIEGTGQ